mmetsp:Transcript_20813/g.46610  ORF Transcript_20813/g.46610 Transcript_20813/m.46610 type:complete len:278 (+) Transcript_20813:1441-2274(+)
MDTILSAAEVAAVARPVATSPVGKASARKSRAAAMRLIQRSSRGVLARRALILSIISRAKSARLIMAASYSSAVLRKLPTPREERRSVLLTRSTCWTTLPSEPVSSSLSCFTFGECVDKHSNARMGLPNASRVESSRNMFLSLRSCSRRSIELMNTVMSTSSSHGRLLTAWSVSERSFNGRSKSIVPQIWTTKVTERMLLSSLLSARAATMSAMKMGRLRKKALYTFLSDAQKHVVHTEPIEPIRSLSFPHATVTRSNPLPCRKPVCASATLPASSM